MKTTITKSRAGHYSVTIRGDFGIRRVNLLSHLTEARRIAATLKADPDAVLDVPVSTSIYW